MQDNDLSQVLQAQVEQAYRQQRAVCIRGGGTKTWYGGVEQGEVLAVAEHSGIVSYEPTELVITARAGTPLAAIEQALAEKGQGLPFEPPYFGEQVTLGGTIACNFSGPARPYTGSARDFVLGCHLLNGKGEMLKFGGQVMKNVAGYDVSRLMAGALGTLGVLLDLSLKVLPRPQYSITLVQSLPVVAALKQLQEFALSPYPITGAVWYQGQCFIRLAGAQGAVKQAQAALGGEVLAEAERFWQDLKEQQLPFFQSTNAEYNLWRLALPADTGVLDLDGDCLYDWAGSQRWLYSAQTPEVIRGVVKAQQGHATLFRASSTVAQQWRAQGLSFQALEPALWRHEQALKQAFDPAGILNPNRLYQGL